MSAVGFAVVGIKGYARNHIDSIRRLEAAGAAIALHAVVAQFPDEDPALLEQLRAEGVRVYESLETLFDREKERVEVVSLPISIASHAPLSLESMRAGRHVLCEKPPAATIQEVDAMVEASKGTGRICAIGFQHAYAPALRSLRKHLQDGAIGELRALRSVGIWPRGDGYYRRNPWAGKLTAGGAYVLDGPITNAFAHYLHAMLCLAAPPHALAARVRSVRAELYRARREIEGHDAGCLELVTDEEVRIHFYAAHCAVETVEPEIEIEGSSGRAFWSPSGASCIETGDGSVIALDNAGSDPRAEMFLAVARAVREVEPLPCPVEATRSFVAAIDGAHESSGAIHPIPEAFVERREGPEGGFETLRGIVDLCREAARQRILFSDLPAPWAVSTSPFDLTGFGRFPQRFAGAPGPSA